MVTDDKISGWREEIDSLDFGVLDLLEKRMEVSRKLGAYKKQRGFVVEDRQREEEAVKSRIGKSDLNPEFVKKLFGLIFEESKRIQSENQ